MRLIYLIATLILLAIALTVGDATAQALQRNVPRATGCTSGQAHDPACDVNHNGTIDLVDIQLTAGHWGQSGTYSATYSGVPRTGQTTCYDSAGGVIPCADTGQDGDLQTGNPWPVPRFADNSDGKVTDRLTGLVWLKNARCGQVFLG